MSVNSLREKALNSLNNFLPNASSYYTKNRNFDYGNYFLEKNNLNVSLLSPYVSHRILSEAEIIKSVLEIHTLSSAEKFIQEVLWRNYWKGWLYLRPKVWSEYLSELKINKEKFKNNQNYYNAINGTTDIECFNYWVKELKENRYLHNHARLWFASIWIFTLKLPLTLGADFFLKHLLDGDEASNTLSYRWVAGLQTKDKAYLASKENISKFTNNRFNPDNLEKEFTLPKFIEHLPNKELIKKDNISLDKNYTLIVTPNDLDFRELKKYNLKINNILILTPSILEEITYSKKVLEFKNKALNEIKNNLEKSFNLKVKLIEDLESLEKEICTNINYLSLKLFNGYFNNLLEAKFSKNITYIYKDYDYKLHHFALKGFFNFKKHVLKEDFLKTII